jgi:hypothetical protein
VHECAAIYLDRPSGVAPLQIPGPCRLCAESPSHLTGRETAPLAIFPQEVGDAATSGSLERVQDAKRPGEDGPSSLESGKGFGTSRGCAGIIVAEQDGSQSGFGPTAVRLARPSAHMDLSLSPAIETGSPAC